MYTLYIGIYYFLWMAVYAGKGAVQNLTVMQMATYIAVAWMARAFYYNNLDREISQEIRDGTVAIQLIRPYHYLFVKGCQGFGEGLFRLVLFSLPGMVLVWLLFPIQLPAFGWIWGQFGLCLLFAFVINTQINMITGLFSFLSSKTKGFCEPNG